MATGSLTKGSAATSCTLYPFGKRMAFSPFSGVMGADALLACFFGAGVSFTALK